MWSRKQGETLDSRPALLQNNLFWSKNLPLFPTNSADKIIKLVLQQMFKGLFVYLYMRLVTRETCEFEPISQCDWNTHGLMSPISNGGCMRWVHRIYYTLNRKCGSGQLENCLKGGAQRIFSIKGVLLKRVGVEIKRMGCLPNVNKVRFCCLRSWNQMYAFQ